jgi:hypothetical protein
MYDDDTLALLLSFDNETIGGIVNDVDDVGVGGVELNGSP